jgi:hypothetical protein
MRREPACDSLWDPCDACIPPHTPWPVVKHAYAAAWCAWRGLGRLSVRARKCAQVTRRRLAPGACETAGCGAGVGLACGNDLVPIACDALFAGRFVRDLSPFRTPVIIHLCLTAWRAMRSRQERYSVRGRAQSSRIPLCNTTASQPALSSLLTEPNSFRSCSSSSSQQSPAHLGRSPSRAAATAAAAAASSTRTPPPRGSQRSAVAVSSTGTTDHRQQHMQAGTAAAATVHKVAAGSLHLSRPTWWLESRFHFSFADWYDPKRTSFGALRVVNDDLVKGHAGFGAHPHRSVRQAARPRHASGVARDGARYRWRACVCDPPPPPPPQTVVTNRHGSSARCPCARCPTPAPTPTPIHPRHRHVHARRDAEIFSYVLEGQLSHEDSMANKEALGRGCVQYMSAGTGVVHAVSAARGDSCVCVCVCVCGGWGGGGWGGRGAACMRHRAAPAHACCSWAPCIAAWVLPALLSSRRHAAAPPPCPAPVRRNQTNAGDE